MKLQIDHITKKYGSFVALDNDFSWLIFNNNC